MGRLRNACNSFYRRSQRIIAPSLKYSQDLYEEVLWECSARAGNWLELGCGHQLLPSWRFQQEQQLVKRARLLVGLDYDLPSLVKHRTIRHRIRGDASNLPFRDNVFNLITSNMVFEHLDQPQAQLAEICRVLKPGGLLVFHTPNSLSYSTLLARLVPGPVKARAIWFLQRRKDEDVFPTYYRINTSRRIRRLAGSTGFEVVSVRFIPSTGLFVMIPPLALLELLLIRILLTRVGRPFRPNIVAFLRKPGA